jgi:hypothetical protein
LEWAVNNFLGVSTVKLKTTLVCVAALFHAVASQAAAPLTNVNLDFTTALPGSSVSVLDGVSFSLYNDLNSPALSATPKINKLDIAQYVYDPDEGEEIFKGYLPANGVSNSSTGLASSTSHILSVVFDGLANGVSFTFNNQGQSSPGTGTNVTVYSSSGSSTIALGQSFNGTSFNLLAYTDVSRLVFNNNTQGNTNWLFSISSLHATVVSAVPEPTSAAMLGLGLMALIAVRRRNFY